MERVVSALMPTRKAKRARAKYNMRDMKHLFKNVSPRGESRKSRFSTLWKEYVD